MFRRQTGRITARLTRVLGTARLGLVEDTVQEAMLKALQTWPYHGLPAQPEAWLYRAAYNAAIDALRRERFVGGKTDAITQGLYGGNGLADLPCDESEIRDDELRMILMCCHPEISREARIALSLKIAGGFNVSEIARAFFAEEGAIAQRLVRAKRKMVERQLSLEIPQGSELTERLGTVLEVIYLVFNEGYAAHEGEDLIRQDLCAEALRLGQLIAHSRIAVPRAHALVALMALQAARSGARTDAVGDLVLLENQDRALWDDRLIAYGFHQFDLAMSGEEVSTYHVQAAIAATHARASDGTPIDWRCILELYEQWFSIEPSAVVALNRAVAIAKVRGPAEALAALEPLMNDEKLRRYYLLLATRGHLLLQLSRYAEASVCFEEALRRPCSEPERRFLHRRIADCGPATCDG